jgi:uncharacterized paraquat-inducible protein A
MHFRMEPANRIMRLFAGLVLMGFGAPLFLYHSLPAMLLGLLICGTGLGVVAWQGWRMWQEREDPYDLNRLWDKPPAEPDKALEMRGDENLVYCHRCGISMSEAHSICPKCGHFLDC